MDEQTPASPSRFPSENPDAAIDNTKQQRSARCSQAKKPIISRQDDEPEITQNFDLSLEEEYEYEYQNRLTTENSQIS